MYIPPFLQNPGNSHSLISTTEVNDLLQDRLLDTPRGKHIEDKVSLSEASKSPSLELTPVSDRPTAQQSADVILGFIGQYLQGRAADGASAEELEESYQAALKGFKQGLSEAVEIIDGLGLSNEALSDSIAETERLVLEGLNKLFKALTGDDLSSVEQSDIPSTAKTVVSATSSESISASSQVLSRSSGEGPIQAAAVSYAESYSRNESVDLQVLTQDGDRITLSYSAAFASSQSSSAAVALGNGSSALASSFSSSSSSSANFSLSVEGYLDQGERDALSSLLAQIEELADEFFGGDLKEAFELALELEMDFTELAALSLDLNQSTTQSAAASYSAVQQLAEPEAEDTGKPKNSGLGNLVQAGKFIGRLLESLEKATEHFSEPNNLLADLLANQLAQRSPDDVKEPAHLLDRLLEQIS